MTTGGSTIDIKSSLELRSILTNPTNKGRLVVIDFWAAWCGPCRMVASYYSKMAAQYRQAIFLKVDTMAVQDVAREYRATALPTFVFIKAGQGQVDLVRGANPPLLEQTVRKHAGPPSSVSSGSFSGTGNRLGSEGNGTSSAGSVNNIPLPAGPRGASLRELANSVDGNVKLLVLFVAAYGILMYLSK